jgi:hypothetical protein
LLTWTRGAPTFSHNCDSLPGPKITRIKLADPTQALCVSDPQPLVAQGDNALGS